jgi:hypothetical protein
LLFSKERVERKGEFLAVRMADKERFFVLLFNELLTIGMLERLY